LSNLWQVDKNHYVAAIADGLQVAARCHDDYCLSQLLRLCDSPREVEIASPGAIANILREASRGKTNILTLLNWACKEGYNPDYWGFGFVEAAHCSDHIVARMLELGANPNLSNEDEDNLYTGQGKTILHLVQDRDMKSLHMLLAAGARTDAVDYHGRTPIHAAARNCNPGVLKVLLEQPGAAALLNWRDVRDETPLQGLLRKRRGPDDHIKQAEFDLIKAGADPNLPLPRPRTPPREGYMWCDSE
jgi:Ankyrin repeats (3 copies)